MVKDNQPLNNTSPSHMEEVNVKFFGRHVGAGKSVENWKYRENEETIATAYISFYILSRRQFLLRICSEFLHQMFDNKQI